MSTEIRVVFRVDPNDDELSSGLSPMAVTATVDEQPLVILADVYQPNPRDIGVVVLNLLLAAVADGEGEPK
jgi:hypothetical protein